jgi:hypothetical protein
VRIGSATDLEEGYEEVIGFDACYSHSQQETSDRCKCASWNFSTIAFENEQGRGETIFSCLVGLPNLTPCLTVKGARIPDSDPPSHLGIRLGNFARKFRILGRNHFLPVVWARPRGARQRADRTS